MRVLTWNLFHGRAEPAAGRPLLVEFARTLASFEWDVALLQEVPPWWPPALAQVSRAQQRAVPTSGTALLPLRAAIGRRNPDLIASRGGSCNAILARGPIGEHREARLTRGPQRRMAHAISLAGGGWAVNLQASPRPPQAARADVERARAAALAWAGAEPVILGGDFNSTDPAVEGFAHAGGHLVDHVFVRGVRGGDPRVLDAGTLSDHRPLVVSVG